MTQVTVVVTNPKEDPNLTEAQTKQPIYPASVPRVEQGKEGSVIAPSFDDPTTDVVETKPDKVKFEKVTDPAEPTPDWVTVDPSTGALTLNPTENVAPGGYTIPVKVTYGDGSKEIVTVPVIITAPQVRKVADTAQPYYPSKTPVVFAGEKETVTAPTFDDPTTPETESKPDGTTFTKGEGAPDWVTVDKDTGALILEPGANIPTGSHRIPIVVSYGDGSTETVYKEVMVANSKLRYEDVTLDRLPTKVENNLGDNIVPGSSFRLVEVPEGWTVSINDKTGAITIESVPEGTAPGPYTIRVEGLADGEVISHASFTVTVPEAQTPGAQGSSEEEKIGAIVGGVLGVLGVLGGGAWALDQLGIIDAGSSAPGHHAKPDTPQLPQTPGDSQAPKSQAPKGDGEVGEPIRPGNGTTNQDPGKHSKKGSGLADTGVQYVQLALTIGFLSLLLGGAFIGLRCRKESE